MWLSNALLKKIQEFKTLGIDYPRLGGTQVGRGFADLGFEQFVLLSEQQQIVSLFNGAKSSIPPEHEKFFFWIPSIADIVTRLQERGWCIETISYPEQRAWVVRLTSAGKPQKEFRHQDLYELMIDVLWSIEKEVAAS